MDASLVHQLNASSPMDLSELGSSMLSIAEHLKNAFSWMSVTLPGIVTLSSDVQLSNRPLLMDVRELGRVTVMSPVHCWKTFSPMWETVSGITISVRPVQW